MTALADVIVKYIGAKDLEDLMRGYTTYEYQIGAEAAPIVFQVAEQGDKVARELIHWAGVELGEIANAVIRQLEFENLAFDVVMTGSMFEGGPMLINPMRETIHKLAPKAHLVRLNTPPVIGAVILGMEAAAIQVTPEIRKTMIESISILRNMTVR
jgi:N-acetylglucosamine kinase-like BadF-type ATPase